MDTSQEIEITQINTEIEVLEFSSQHLVHLQFEPPILPGIYYDNVCKTFCLNPFVLNSEHIMDCCMSFEFDMCQKMQIRVRIQSKLIRKISKIVLSTRSEPLGFVNFDLYSSDPFECLSKDYVYAYNFPKTIYEGFSSGFIYYEIIDRSSERAILKNCLQMGDYHDLIMKIDDGEEFKVHKIIVASRSPVFKKMIDANMMEKATGVICMKDVQFDVMEEILNFIYGQPCDLSRSPHGIFQTAHLYELTELADQSRRYMVKNISYENFFGIWKLTDIEGYDLKEVKHALDRFLTDKESEIVKNPDFIEFLTNNMQNQSIDYLFRLCMQYNLNVKEKVVKFILNNLDEVLKNSEFTKLLRSNPDWSIEIFGILGTKSNPKISFD